MTNTQREAMQVTLAFIQDIDRDDNDRDILSPNQCEALDASRNALRAALDEPVVEPVIDDSTVLAACQKLAPTLFTRGLKPLETDGANWRAMMQEVETTVRNVLSFVNAPQPPAEVPLLTDNEILGIWNMEIGVDEMNQREAFKFARAIEQAVRIK